MKQPNKYEYTRYMQDLVNEYMDEISAFYCREDIYNAMVAFNNAKKDARIFRQADLKRLCDAVGIDIGDLKRNPAILKQVPSRAQLKNTMMEALYGMYREFPRANDYMRRMIAYLAPEFASDTVRVAILKKFVLGCGYGCRTIDAGSVLEWARKRAPAERYIDEAVIPAEVLAGYITDDIFVNMDGRLTPQDTLALMIKRMDRCINEPDKYYTKDENGGRHAITDFIVADGTRQKIEDICRKYSAAGERLFDRLAALSLRYINNSDIDQFFDELSADFREQTRVMYYVTRKGDEDRVMELFKLDCRDARKSMNKGWEILQICDDLANGRFRVNGKTKVYLYYFAFMFGMKANVPGGEEIESKLDIDKNLFQDYYSDNMMRYLEDEYHDAAVMSAYEREPTGEGINWKNFVECIYIYYLNKADSGDTPGKRLDLAAADIRACIRRGRDAAVPTRAVSNYTRFYRDNEMRVLMSKKPGEVVNYVISNYSIVSAENNESARIMIAAEERSATDLMIETMTWLEEAYDGETLPFDVKKDKLAQADSRIAKLRFEWELSGLLRGKYGSDEGFMRIVDAIDSRLNTEENRIVGVKNSRVTRSGLIALYFNYYKSLMEDTGDISSFPELYEDFCCSIDPVLEEARYQRIDPKNILDMYVVFSLYFHMLEQRG